MSELSDNLRSVREEAMGMLDTIEKVRGQKYASSVHALLLIQQVAKLTAMMVRGLEKTEPTLALAGRTATPELLTQLGLAISKITDYGDERWKEIIQDVESIDQSVDRLASSAITAAKKGKDFGGSNAA